MSYYLQRCLRRSLRRFRRRLLRMTPQQQRLAAAVIGGAILITVARHPHPALHLPSAGRPATTTAAAGLSGGPTTAGSYTPASWAVALLTAAGLPRTRCNVNALVGWETAEGGNWGNNARYNPLDTTQPEPGSTGINSVNVQAYPSWRVGFDATVTTLNNGNYGAILAALASGGSAQAVADAVAASPWGTGAYTASC